MILGYLMYRSGLVPRRMALFGSLEGPLILLLRAARAVRCIGLGSSRAVHLLDPRDHLELSLGIYLTSRDLSSLRSSRSMRGLTRTRTRSSGGVTPVQRTRVAEQIGQVHLSHSEGLAAYSAEELDATPGARN